MQPPYTRWCVCVWCDTVSCDSTRQAAVWRTPPPKHPDETEMKALRAQTHSVWTWIAAIHPQERAHCFTKRYLGFANCMAIAIIAHIGNPMTTHSKKQTNYTNVDTDTTTQCTLDHNQPRRGNDVAPHTFQKVKLLKVMANPKSIDIPTNAQRGSRTDDVIVEG